MIMMKQPSHYSSNASSNSNNDSDGTADNSNDSASNQIIDCNNIRMIIIVNADSHSIRMIILNTLVS